MGPRRVLAVVTAGAVLLATGAWAAPAAWAVDDDGLQWEVSIDDRDVETATPDDPVGLDWREPVVVDVRVRNDRPDPVAITRVRLEARVLGLAFFSYTTDVDIDLAPGAEDRRVYTLNLQDLYGQATGKLPGRVVLLDGRDEVSSVAVPVDVRAPLRSVYGLFGIGVAAVTAVLVWGALWSLARGRLHANRWRRATTFAVPGVGLGFTLTFTVSALGLFLPSAPVWLTLVMVCGGAGFLVGYLTPTPDAAGTDDEGEMELGEGLDGSGTGAEQTSEADAEDPADGGEEDAVFTFPWSEADPRDATQPGPGLGGRAGADAWPHDPERG